MADYSTHNDTELLSLFKDGNQGAYTEFYRRYFTPLYRQSLEMLKDEQAAADAVQNVFMYLWEHREQLDGISKPRHYLYRALRNMALKQMLTSRREADYISDFSKFTLQHSQPADHVLRSRQLQDAITQEVNNLPERMRQVYLLKREENLSHNEIAERLNISPLTSRTQMNKALHQLWSKLSSWIIMLVISMIIFY